MVSVLIERKVAVHHCGDTDAADLGESYAELLLNICLQCLVAFLNSLMDEIHGVCPDAVLETVLPFEVALCNRQMVLVDQDCLDTCGT